MSSKVVSNDKENTQMVFAMKKNLVKSENSKPKLNALKSINEQSITSDPKRRRALGDVFNTTSVVTKPVLKEDTNKLNKKLVQKPVKTKCVETNDDGLDFVEKCHTHVDTFDDLFENGKISDLFVRSKVNMVPRLPSGSIAARLQDEFVHFTSTIDDSNWKKQLHNVNKMLRKERNCKQEDLFIEPEVSELPELEMPSFLNDF